MTEFLKGNSKIDQIVIDTTTGKDASFEGMRAALRAHLQASGVIAASDRDNGELGVRLMPVQVPETTAAPAAAQPPANPTHVAVVYPHGNDRFEVFASSQEELDQKVAQIHAMFGGQR